MLAFLEGISLANSFQPAWATSAEGTFLSTPRASCLSRPLSGHVEWDLDWSCEDRSVDSSSRRRTRIFWHVIRLKGLKGLKGLEKRGHTERP